MFGFTSHYHPHQWHQQIEMISNRKTHGGRNFGDVPWSDSYVQHQGGNV